jgi:uncharacterized repeat protein (TIGR01451 family)
MQWRRLIPLMVTLFAPTTTLASAPQNACASKGASFHSAIISNGVVDLGVADEGHLNVNGGSPSAGDGTTVVGLRYTATNGEAIAPGCLCEGWGVADAGTGETAHSGIDVGGVGVNLTLQEFTATSSEARSVVTAFSRLKVTHSYHPSPSTKFLYVADVTIENISTTDVADLRYTRGMDWDIYPTTFNEFVTIQGVGSAANLLYADDNGFQTPDPLGSRSPILSSGNQVDSGPSDHGALFDFAFGRLAVGESRTFRIFYGAAGSEPDALNALTAVRAEAYSLGQPSSDPLYGSPNTFIFAFSGVGGDPLIPGTIEKSSIQDEAMESAVSRKGVIENGVFTGGLEGSLTFTDIEVVTITSGSFAGKGFSKGHWQASISGVLHQGEWKGVLATNEADRSIQLMGTVSGDLQGTVEGDLRETTASSGVFDHYAATWRVGMVRGVSTSVVLDVQGTLTGEVQSAFPETNLTIVLASFEGDLQGDYESPLSTVLTCVRVANGAPYVGEGFAVISYSGSSGNGRAWGYVHESSAKIFDLDGISEKPFYGILSGRLNESGTARSLYLNVTRVDKGLLPLPDLQVMTWGPQRVSPGQTVNYVIEYYNGGVSSTNDLVVVEALDSNLEYVSASAGGIYRPDVQEISWKLGAVAPGTIGYLYAQVKARFGLSVGTSIRNGVKVGTTSDELDVHYTGLSPLPDLNVYANVSSTREVQDIPPADLAVLLSQDAQYADIHGLAAEQGFVDADLSMRLAQDSGTLMTTSLMTSDTGDEGALVVRMDGVDKTGYFLIRVNDGGFSLSDRYGGLSQEFATGKTTRLGEHHSCAWWACVANCLMDKVPGWVLDYTVKAIGKAAERAWKISKTSYYCVRWAGESDPAKKEDYRSSCLLEVATAIKDIPGLGEGFESMMCIAECSIYRQSNPGYFMCVPGTTKERCEGHILDPLRFKTTYSCNDACEWEVVGKEECLPRPTGFWGYSGWCSQQTETSARCVPEKMPNADDHESKVQVARDPNVLYGPEGSITAGQKMDYRVEFENEGDGIAFAVYFTAVLDEGLDDSTLTIGSVKGKDSGLEIAPAGTYDPYSRTITWLVGEVGSRQGGYADFSLNARADLSDGDDIFEFATVYFPSVPEVTPTNALVAIVGTDQCPGDPAKVQPGTCGCGLSDLDTDKDGVADCRDLCPYDPLDDSDGDGRCDSDDDSDPTTGIDAGTGEGVDGGVIDGGAIDGGAIDGGPVDAPTSTGGSYGGWIGYGVGGASGNGGGGGAGGISATGGASGSPTGGALGPLGIGGVIDASAGNGGSGGTAGRDGSGGIVSSTPLDAPSLDAWALVDTEDDLPAVDGSGSDVVDAGANLPLDTSVVDVSTVGDGPSNGLDDATPMEAGIPASLADGGIAVVVDAVFAVDVASGDNSKGGGCSCAIGGGEGALRDRHHVALALLGLALLLRSLRRKR